MNRNKVITLAILAALTIGVVGCNKKTEPTPESQQKQEEIKMMSKDEYQKLYTTGYNDYIVGLNEYGMYSNPIEIEQIYKGKEYPGNEGYIKDLKNAYSDSKAKLQSFEESLKKDVNVEDKELKKINEDLIAECDKIVKEIDVKMKKLDEIPKESYSKTKEEFAKLVADATVAKDKTENMFKQKLDELNNMFGINKK